MSQYELQARQFCRETGTRVTIRRAGEVDRFPRENKPTGRRYKYRVTIERNGHRYNTPFHGSIADYQTNRRVTPYDVLACLLKSDPGDFWEFASEYGYEITSKAAYDRAYGVYTDCVKEYAAVERLFSDVMNQLQNIQ